LASILENWRQKIKIGDFFGSNIFGARATTDYGIYFLQKQVPVFNFNNPQSSQKRQSDDSGLQIAKTKYKRILPLSFSDSDSE
jgi:hypothetical protein